ncbi:LysM domain-containing protein [Agromyces protaetiae]|uniref:LysM domain-containing protein n=1 Tax=Agromyces protaetiae TaxID=2509455 RepID=A0A4P6F8S6_9MICO|nr:LysM domain-containing protein [Agromyces protaetiae]QAY72510.1 LysM domain-containing protein [Agromyces protaetiae]
MTPTRTRRSALPAPAALLMTLAAVPLLLTGCFPSEEKPVETVYVTVPAKPAPTTVQPVTPTVAPEPPAPPAAEPAPPVPNDPAPVYEPGPAYDNGPVPGANGPTDVDGNGVPSIYTVVSGDSFFDIAQRFDLPQQQLLRMNPQIHDFGETVYIGDKINLDWQRVGLG